jgi:hypothetical protein
MRERHGTDDPSCDPALAKTSWLTVTFGDAGDERAEAPGRWSGIEGSQVSEELSAGPMRAELKHGG